MAYVSEHSEAEFSHVRVKQDRRGKLNENREAYDDRFQSHDSLS